MVRHELRILRRDPVPLVMLMLMPLVLMAFIKPAFAGNIGRASASGTNNGAEQAVPGMAVMFAFFLVAHVGFAFFREHGWNTWERLRASAATPTELMIGKVLPGFVTVAVQLAVLLGVGGFLFDLHIRGSIGGIFVVGFFFAGAVVAIGLAMASFCSSAIQVNAVANLLGLVCAGLGGALTPVSTLPNWARALAPITPNYWGMRGFRAIIVDGDGLDAAVLPSAVLLGFGVAFALLTVWRFRFEESKMGWA